MSDPAACPSCHAAIAADASFCTHCGKPVAVVAETGASETPADAPADATAVAPGVRLAPHGPRQRASSYRDRLVAQQAAQDVKQLHTAGRWILALVAIFVIAGTYAGFMHRNQAQQVLAGLASRDADEVVEIEGEEQTIAELRDAIRAETIQVFVVNYLLAALFLGLFFWSRKAPLPATIVALCIYLAVNVLNAIIDPTTLLQGLVLKGFCIASLAAGIRAAVAQRPAPRAVA